MVSLSERNSGWSVGFIDYNDDGWKDVFSANGDVDNLRAHFEQHDTMSENVSGREFARVSAQMGEDFLRERDSSAGPPSRISTTRDSWTSS